MLEVEFQDPTLVATEDSAARTRSTFLASQEALRTIEQNLTNQTLLARVIRSEGLAQDDGRALFGGENIASSSKPSATPGTGPSPDANKTQSAVGVRTFTPLEEALGRAVAGMVNPVIRRGTRLIDLYVTNRDPVMAQRLADAIGREYIRNSIERRASLSEESLRYLLEEEERLKAQSAKKRGGGCGIQSEKSRRLATWRRHRRDRVTDGIGRRGGWCTGRPGRGQAARYKQQIDGGKGRPASP